MITIRPINPPVTVQYLLDLNGHLHLDTPPGMELRITKTLDKVDQLGRITQEAALSVTMPYTDRNRAFFAEYEPDALRRKSGRFAVEVAHDGDRQSLTSGRVTNSGAGGYELELFGDDWLQDIEDLRLDALDLGTFVWNRANIIDAWGTGRTAPLALPGIASYGGFSAPGTVTLKDVRMWWNVGSLLRALLCAAGWSFVSPHFDDGDGRYWYAYLSGLRWHTYRTKKGPQFVELSVGSLSRNGDPLQALAWTEVQDDDNRWGTVGNDQENSYTYFHDSAVDQIALVSVEIELNVTLPVGSNAETPILYVELVETTNDGAAFGTTLFRDQYTGGEVTARTVQVSADFYLERTLTVGTDVRKYEVFFYYEDSAGAVAFTINSASLIYRPDPRYYVEGDTITLGDLLDGEISGKELFEAVAHLLNAKIVTDYAKKEVTMYAPYDYARTEDNNTVPGFYQPRPVDLRNQTVPDSVEWSDDQETAPRFRVYDFASGDDAIVKERGRDRFRRKVDLGRGTSDETEYKNPLFGPTLNLRMPAEIVAGTGIVMPALWSDLDGTINHEPGPRIAVWYGQVEQGDPSAPNTWSFDGEDQTTVPVLSMISGAGIGEGQKPEPITFTGFVNDLYNRHYRGEIEQGGPTVSVLLTGGDATYDLITFRKTLLVKGATGDYELQPSAVRDHARGSGVALLIEGKNKMF